MNSKQKEIIALFEKAGKNLLNRMSPKDKEVAVKLDDRSREIQKELLLSVIKGDEEKINELNEELEELTIRMTLLGMKYPAPPEEAKEVLVAFVDLLNDGGIDEVRKKHAICH